MRRVRANSGRQVVAVAAAAVDATAAGDMVAGVTVVASEEAATSHPAPPLDTVAESAVSADLRLLPI